MTVRTIGRWGLGPVVVAVVVALAGGIAGAQSVPGGTPPTTEFGVRAPETRPPFELGLEPTLPPETRGTREQEFYPGVPIRSRHDPAFVRPFVKTVPVSRTSSVRVGVSGWTAPALPYDFRESTGGVAFGLTILWGGPAVEPVVPEPESTGQR
jgi:hypothetical protein